MRDSVVLIWCIMNMMLSIAAIWLFMYFNHNTNTRFDSMESRLDSVVVDQKLIDYHLDRIESSMNRDTVVVQFVRPVNVRGSIRVIE